MLREQLSDALKTALKRGDQRAVSTLRLILAALKDRDIAARGKGNETGVSDEEILGMLRTMIRQRHESIAHYEKGGRLELAQQEAEEIEVIERFLPRQLDDTETTTAIAEAIRDTGAVGLKDMGKVMAALRAKHPGEIDFAQASQLVRDQLSNV